MTIYSYSRVNTYFTCPAQFQFRYIEKRPSPVAEGIELFLGSRFHETMEYLYGLTPTRIPTVNELLEYFKKHWENHWKQALTKQAAKGYSDTLRVVNSGQTVEDYYQKGQLFVENYYHQYQPFDQDRTEGLEMRVAFDLDPKGEYKMQGFIDRLGVDDEGILWIHDYKTSSRKMSEEDVKTEDQLALYQIGLNQNPKYGPKSNIKLIWHFVAFEKDQVVAERNPKELGWLKDKYIQKIQTIEKAKTFPTKPSALCSWCEYLSVCTDGKAWVENRKKKKQDTKEAVLKVAESTEIVSQAKPVVEKREAGPGDPRTSPEPIPSRRGKRASRDKYSPDQLSFF